MKAISHLFKALCWISFLAILTGCSTNYELPDDMASMEDIFEEHSAAARVHISDREKARHRISRATQPNDLDLGGYTRDTYNEINNLFPKLPNPTLVMYVYPHLTSTHELPVPGYSTAFSMYEKEHYAMPGEVRGN